MTTIVTTQQELDDAITAGTPEIEIRSERGVWLTIGDTRDSDVTVAGESEIEEVSGRVGRVVGSGRVGRVVDSGRVEWVVGSGSVEWVVGSGSVGRVVDSGSVGHASGTATVHLHDAAHLEKAGSHGGGRRVTATLKPGPSTPDPDAPRLAQVAARLIERVGEDAVRAHLPRIKVRAPRPTVAILACACGVMLDARDMRWAARGHSAVVNRITCRACARNRS